MNANTNLNIRKTKNVTWNIFYKFVGIILHEN